MTVPRETSTAVGHGAVRLGASRCNGFKSAYTERVDQPNQRR